jgi:hypothetical protein
MDLSVPEPLRRRNSVDFKPVSRSTREDIDIFEKEKNEIMKIYHDALAMPSNRSNSRDFVISSTTILNPIQLKLVKMIFDLEILYEKYKMMDEKSIRRVINPEIILIAYLRPRLNSPDSPKYLWLSDLEKLVLKNHSD